MARLGDTLDFQAQLYSVTGDVLTGATVTVNIRKPDLSLAVTGGTATEISASGVYRYAYASSDAVGRWQAQFMTANANADVLKVTKWIDVDVAELPINATAILAAVGTPMQAGSSVTVGTVNDKTGYALDSAYDAAKTAATQASVNALGSPMQASAYLAPDNAGIAAIQAKTDHLPSTPAATGDAMTLTGAYDAAKTAATQASVDAIHANVAVLTGGAGIFAVTIQVYRSGTTTPIADVSACVSDSNGDVTGFCQRSSAGGLCVFALNAGTYSLRLLKSGYQFAVVALTVTADLTQTVFGEPVAIPAPSDAESCVVYEYCFDAASQTPLSRVTATAAIISLPYNYAGRLHSCADVAGTYLATTGLLSWELARGAVVWFKIREVGVARRVTIPNAATARLSDLR